MTAFAHTHHNNAPLYGQHHGDGLYKGLADLLLQAYDCRRFNIKSSTCHGKRPRGSLWIQAGRGSMEWVGHGGILGTPWARPVLFGQTAQLTAYACWAKPFACIKALPIFT